MDKAALNRATDSTSAPTPGYLYNDIAKSLNTPQTCSDTLNYLLLRLSKNNVHMKRKSLKVLSKIASHPSSRGMMKRTVVQNPSAICAIKEALAYRGTVDAVTGDTYNLEVREAAKECLEVVYSDAGEMSSTMTGGGLGGGGGMMMMMMGGTATGYGGGGAAYGAPMGGPPGSGMGGGGGGTTSPTSRGGTSSSRMEGIGNPMFADPRLTQNTNAGGGGLGQLGEIASSVGGAMLEMIKDPLARNIEAAVIGGGFGGARGGGGGGYNPNARPDPYSQPPPGRGNLSMQTGGQWTMASNRGPNAIGSASNSIPPTTTTQHHHHHQNSEYYKTRDAQQGGQAFSWASSGGGGGGAAPDAAAAAASGPHNAPTGVGGSWATAPVAPPPSHHHNRTVASTTALQPPVSMTQPNNYTGGNSYGVGVGAAAAPAGGGGDYERNLIQDLCPPGGMKAEPPQDKLDEFARAIPSLNPDVVCPALLDALEEGNPWIIRAKALCVIETVLKVEAERNNGEVQAYTDFFHACSGEIEPLVNHARASVKGPAKRVLALLGIDEIPVNGSANATVAAQDPVVQAPNLLDFDDEPVPSPVTSTLPTDASLRPQAGVNSSITVTASSGPSLFSGLNTKAASDAAVAVVAASAQSSVPAVPVTLPPQHQDDLLGGIVSEPLDAATSNSADLFSNVSVKSMDGKVESATLNGAASESSGNAALSAASGSAFGFMNATPASPVPPPPATAASPATPSSASFDPLLSMGLSSNNATIAPIPNMTPQMQQMQIAYQQNMMMMQQQMQQMQMQRGNVVVPGLPLSTPFVSPIPTQASKQPIMGANYMRQVPGVSGDKMSSFSFLGSDPKKKDNNSFDFVRDAMKNEKK